MARVVAFVPALPRNRRPMRAAARRPFRPSFLGSCVLAAALSACAEQTSTPPPAGDGASRWRSLTEGYTFAWDGEPRSAGSQRLSIESIEGRPWLAVDHDDAQWTRLALPGVFATPRLAPAFEASARFAVRQLVLADGEPLTYRSGSAILEAGLDFDAGSYGFFDDQLCVALPDGMDAPTSVRHLVELPIGVPDATRWRIDVGFATGAGVVALPGVAPSLELPAGGPRRLSFGAFAFQSPEEGDLALALTVDGREVWRHEVSADATGGSSLVHGAVELDASDEPATLKLECEGSFTIAGLLAPVIGPSLAGQSASRALDGRPNVVVFLADTFRADGLVTQRRFRDSDDDYRLVHLEALAAESRRFERTWSTSSWTLPAHASLFTSLNARQHGVRTAFATLPSSAHTLAETMRNAGYRTVAVTDGGYVSSSFGLAQGFELFLQLQDGERHTLERATQILATGDGRPTFLFVQSYMPHNPFDPSIDARRALGLEADAPREVDVISGANAAIATGADDAWLDPDVAALRRLYRAQLLDFDTAFGAWYARFEDLGWADNSHLFFTSDHGEAFGHHEWLMHIGPAYEVLTRVPLLWSGPKVPSGVDQRAVSLVDLAPTIARLGGASVPAAWRGHALEEPDDQRLAWSSWIPANRFSAAANERADGRLTATNGVHRVYFDETGARVQRVFDIADDPDEAHALSSGSDAWPEAFVRRAQGDVETETTQTVPDGARAAPGQGLVDRLRQLGYLGGDE